MRGDLHFYTRQSSFHSTTASIQIKIKMLQGQKKCKRVVIQIGLIVMCIIICVGVLYLTDHFIRSFICRDQYFIGAIDECEFGMMCPASKLIGHSLQSEPFRLLKNKAGNCAANAAMQALAGNVAIRDYFKGAHFEYVVDMNWQQSCWDWIWGYKTWNRRPKLLKLAEQLQLFFNSETTECDSFSVQDDLIKDALIESGMSGAFTGAGLKYLKEGWWFDMLDKQSGLTFDRETLTGFSIFNMLAIRELVSLMYALRLDGFRNFEESTELFEIQFPYYFVGKGSRVESRNKAVVFVGDADSVLNDAIYWFESGWFVQAFMFEAVYIYRNLRNPFWQSPLPDTDEQIKPFNFHMIAVVNVCPGIDPECHEWRIMDDDTTWSTFTANSAEKAYAESVKRITEGQDDTRRWLQKQYPKRFKDEYLFSTMPRSPVLGMPSFYVNKN